MLTTVLRAQSDLQTRPRVEKPFLYPHDKVLRLSVEFTVESAEICTAETILRGFAEATTWMACQKASSKIFKLLVDEHGLKKEELPTCVRDKIDSALKERREQFPSERGNIDREKDRARMPPPSGPPSKKARTS